jgi:hypothetical protein
LGVHPGEFDGAAYIATGVISRAVQPDSLTINCVAPPTPTATPTPPPVPRMQKLPALQSLFLTRPPQKLTRCLDSTNIATLTEALSQAITSLDPKDPSQAQRLGAFEFEVRFDPKLVCVELHPGPAAANMICTIQDEISSLLEGIARMGCVSKGKQFFPDTATEEGRHLADILVRPQPELYTQIKPNQDNGIPVQLLNQNCELADLQGHPIPIFSCDDADVTVRYLEGDVIADCRVNALDMQNVAFRWGATLGTLVYHGFMDLEPSGFRTGGLRGDGDIDINDLQFVYGRAASMCTLPWPPQPPVNPKA